MDPTVREGIKRRTGHSSTTPKPSHSLSNKLSNLNGLYIESGTHNNNEHFFCWRYSNNTGEIRSLCTMGTLSHPPGICPRGKCGCLCGPRIPDWKMKTSWISSRPALRLPLCFRNVSSPRSITRMLHPSLLQLILPIVQSNEELTNAGCASW